MSRALKLYALLLFLAAICSAQDLASFEKRVTVKVLPNGLTAIVCQRPDTAPVFSFYTNVDAGSVQDPMGKTGLAHMFEHMAFKGTADIGTKDYPAEKAALEKVESAYAAYLDERDKPVGRDEQKLKQLEQAPDRITVGAHAALFHHHVPLLVKLAKHGVGVAVGFEVGPEFQTIQRE